MKRLVFTFAIMLIARRTFAQSPFEGNAAQELKEGLAQAELELAQASNSLGLYTPLHPNVLSQTKDLVAALETGGLQGTWWRNARWIRELNLTPEQQKKMDEVFRQNKIKLIDLNAGLEKAELMLEPLVENASPGDEAKILAQIDRVADARADLEKANARMLLSIRQVLTPEQWSKLPSSKSNYLRTNIRTATPK
jgi:Spy/CpxP family protein refolding chaperone